MRPSQRTRQYRRAEARKAEVKRNVTIWIWIVLIAAAFLLSDLALILR